MKRLKRIRQRAARAAERNPHKWLREHSKNYKFGRVKSACSGFGRITTFGNKPYGPTHFGCGPGFPENKAKRALSTR